MAGPCLDLPAIRILTKSLQFPPFFSSENICTSECYALGNNRLRIHDADLFFQKKNTHTQKRCQTFLFFRPVGGGERKRRHVDHLLQHVCQIVVCAVLTSIIAVFSAVNWCWRLSAGLSKAHRNLATQHSASSFRLLRECLIFFSSNLCVRSLTFKTSSGPSIYLQLH